CQGGCGLGPQLVGSPARGRPRLVRHRRAGRLFSDHWPGFAQGNQSPARVLLSANSTAPPAATSDAASAQKTAGYEPRPSSSSEAPTGPTARAPLAPSPAAPEIAR